MTKNDQERGGDELIKPSFEELVKNARTGDSDAVGRLIDNYRNYLLLIANDNVDEKLRAKEAASDIVQESIMHAQVHFEQFKGGSESELKAWLKTILANDMRKGRRKFLAQKRDARKEVNIQDQSALGRGLQDEQLTPSSGAIRKEKEKAMAAAMSQLSADQQQVITFRNTDQLSFEEIGARMDRTADAARKLWARAIESLKLSLKLNSPELIEDSNRSGPDHE